MKMLFSSEIASKPKRKYTAKEKVGIIHTCYFDALHRGLDIDELSANTGVHKVTLRYWLKHYEMWLVDSTHSHICIDGVKHLFIRLQ